MQIKNRPTLLGFTLIELMFVIAIASVLATLGMSMVRQHAQQAKIDKTVLQIQQLLQAASAYYVDNQCWPGTATDCLTTSPPSFNGYIPVGGTTNPWGFPYSWRVRNKVFEVQVNTPDPNTADPPIAQRIVALLPNAAAGNGLLGSPCGEDRNCVYAQISTPVQVSFSPIYIAAVGTVNKTNKNTVKFRCRGGYTSRIQYAFQAYDYANEGTRMYSTSFTNILFNNLEPPKYDSTSGQYYYSITLNSNGSYARRCSGLSFGYPIPFPGLLNRVKFFCGTSGDPAAPDRLSRGDAMYDSYTINYVIYCVQ